MKVYSIGKGPSAMTIDAPKAAIELGKSLVISGTVTDISAGTQQSEQLARFPNGVAAVSDESQSLFMEAAYQQQPMYNNMTGVPVTISVIDSNNNFRDIGSTTSDVNGNFGFTWTPDISGDYEVIATFAGSNSYYPSTSSTYFYAGETPTHEPTAPQATGLATTGDLMTYNLGVGIAIIIAIAIVGLLLLRRKP